MKNLLLTLALTLASGAAPALAADAPGALAGLTLSPEAAARLPDASAPVDAHIYLVVVNNDGYFFSSQYECSAYGEKIAGTIAKAGFQIVSHGAQPWRDSNGNTYWEYRVEYSAPGGLLTPDFKTQYQASDSNGNLYQERWEAVAAGRETERVMAEAGYFVLNGWPRHVNTQPAHWEYYIEYTAKAGRNTADTAVYEVSRDKAGQRFTSGSDAAWAAKTFSDKLRAAGYFPLRSRLNALNQDGRLYYSCYVTFIPRAGRAAAEIQYYTVERDENNDTFGMDYMAILAGEAITRKLEAAGYVVLEARHYWQPAYSRWAYHNIYIAPSGYSTGKPQTYLLEKGSDGQPYSGSWGQMRAKSDGDSTAATLEAAGYTVLRRVTRPNWLHPDAWVHEIEYISAAK